MLMILNLHSFWGYDHGNGFLKAFDFFRNTTSICAVDTFILISGYFGIKWKFKSFFNLVFQLFFYSFAVYGVSVASGFLLFDKSELILCFKALYDCWGFVTCYIVLWFVSPWLNAFADKRNKRQLFLFILIFFLAENIIMRASVDVLNFCLIYLIGRLIKKTGAVGNEKCKPGVAFWIITVVIFILAYAANIILHYDALTMGSFILGYSYSSPFVILQAISLFLYFGKLDIQSRWINWCAVSCLSIYLIHMHPAIKQIGYYVFTETLYNYPFFEHIGLLLCLIIIVFICSIFIDKIRIQISDLFYSFIHYLCIKLRIKEIKLESFIPDWSKV